MQQEIRGKWILYPGRYSSGIVAARYNGDVENLICTIQAERRYYLAD